MALAVKAKTKGFVNAIIGMAIGVSLGETLINAIGNMTVTVPMLTTGLVGTVLGAGLVMYLVDNFL